MSKISFLNEHQIIFEIKMPDQFFKTPIGKWILVKEINYVYEIMRGCKGIFSGSLVFVADTFYEKYAKRIYWPNLIYWFDKYLYIMVPIPAIAGKSHQNRDPTRGQGPRIRQHRTQKVGDYWASPKSLLQYRDSKLTAAASYTPNKGEHAGEDGLMAVSQK